MILGVVLVIIGIVLYEGNISNQRRQGWWVWLMLIGGVVLAVTGAILTVFLMRAPPEPLYLGSTTVPVATSTLQTAPYPVTVSTLPYGAPIVTYQVA